LPDCSGKGKEQIVALREKHTNLQKKDD